MGGTPNGSLFSLWICNGILPAEWLEFTADQREDNGVDLNWSTQTEINNDFFSVERSADGLKWEAIGQVEADGNSDIQQRYTFLDRLPLAGDNHYRIRQTSLDGGTSFSEVETVVVANESIHCSPNPATSKVMIEMLNADEAIVTLRNELGQSVVVTRTVSPSKIELNTGELARGVYFLEVHHPQFIYRNTDSNS